MDLQKLDSYFEIKSSTYGIGVYSTEKYKNIHVSLKVSKKETGVCNFYI